MSTVETEQAAQTQSPPQFEVLDFLKRNGYELKGPFKDNGSTFWKIYTGKPHATHIGNVVDNPEFTDSDSPTIAVNYYLHQKGAVPEEMEFTINPYQALEALRFEELLIEEGRRYSRNPTGTMCNFVRFLYGGCFFERLEGILKKP